MIDKIRPYQEKVYFFGLLLLAFCLPVSRYLTSIAQFILIINWMLEGDFLSKWERIKNRKSLWIFLTVYGVHLIGLFYTSDLAYAMKDLKIKLPLLVLPLVIGTSKLLTSKEVKLILQAFVFALLISSLLSLAIYLGLTKIEVNDIRDISYFCSHIRLSLYVNLGLFILLYYVLNPKENTNKYEKTLYVLMALWFFSFLFLLKSLTGLIILGVIGFIFALVWINRQRMFIIRIFGNVAMITIVLLIATFITHSVGKFYAKDEIDIENLDEFTPNGNPYLHDLKNIQIENGHSVGLYICEPELRKEWNQLSSFKYDGKDKKDQDIKYTLIRYLSSLGLRKDSVGMSKLEKSDVELIENGFSNHIFKNRFSLYNKLYVLIWEIDVYLKGGNPSGHSFTQRLEYLKTGSRIIRKNFFFGVGTGDVPDAFNQQYMQDNTRLSEEWQLRAHNQMISWFIAFGFIGFHWILIACTIPLKREKKKHSYFVAAFIMIVFLSTFNEDTFETQAGATFFAFFYSLFVFGFKDLKNNSRGFFNKKHSEDEVMEMGDQGVRE